MRVPEWSLIDQLGNVKAERDTAGQSAKLMTALRRADAELIAALREQLADREDRYQTAMAAWDALRAEVAALKAERDAALAENEALRAGRDALLAENANMIASGGGRDPAVGGAASGGDGDNPRP